MRKATTAGSRQSRGERIILSHDDIEILTPDFAERVERHLERFDLIGVAGTTRLVTGKWELAGDPYAFVLISAPDRESGRYETVLRGGGPLVVPGIQALDGVFMAMRRAVAVSIPFDEAVFDHFHLYDLDFSFRAYQAGFALAVCRDLVLIHQSMGRFDAVWRGVPAPVRGEAPRAPAATAGTRRSACTRHSSRRRPDEVLRALRSGAPRRDRRPDRSARMPTCDSPGARDPGPSATIVHRN